MDPLVLLLALVLFALLGTAAGVATGLVPGFHVNAVAALVLTLQGAFLGLGAALFAWATPTPEDLVLLVAALVVGHVVAHTFLDYVPSIFLGAPEAETALSVLPGHRMLLRGLGLEAVRLSARGSLLAALLSLLLILPFRLFMGPPVDGYGDLRPVLGLLLVLVAALLVVSEGGTPLGRREFLCHLPEGVLPPGDPLPPLPQVSPGAAARAEGAFLLRGSVLRQGEEGVVLTDGTAEVHVRLEGPPAALEGEVALCVARVRRRRHPLLGRGLATALFLLSGLLGYLVLLTPLLTRNWFPLGDGRGDPTTVGFLPLFTGLFGLPTLLLSLARAPRIPPQELRPASTPLGRRATVRAVLGGTLAGSFVAWIPGVTAATATVLSQLLSGREEGSSGSDEEFILSLSCVNTATALFTVVALFVILRARSGGAAAVQALAGGLLAPWEPLASVPVALLLFLTAASVAAVAAYLLTGAFGSLFARMASRVPYRWLAGGVLSFLLVLVLLLSGVAGLAVAAVATCLGLLPPLLGLRRVHLMGSLLLPLVLLLG